MNFSKFHVRIKRLIPYFSNANQLAVRKSVDIVFEYVFIYNLRQTYFFYYSLLPCATYFGCKCWKSSDAIKNLIEKVPFEIDPPREIEKVDEEMKLCQTNNQHYNHLSHKEEIKVAVEEQIQNLNIS
jgi:hypothetical protein